MNLPSSWSKEASPADGGESLAAQSGWGRRQAWTVSFKLARPGHRRSSPLTSDQVAQLLMELRNEAPVVTNLDRGFAVTFTVIGSFESCVLQGTERMWAALEAACIEGFLITSARLVNHQDFDEVEGSDPVPAYYGITECAMALQVSKQRISQLVHAGDFPPPDAVVGTRPAWLESTIRRAGEQRRKLGTWSGN